VEIRTMSGLVSDSLQTDRFLQQLSEGFGLLAMLLASIGLYGIMAYTVARRTRDIGIRLALGGTHLVRSMIFGLGFADPVALLVAAALLAMVAALAGFLPAWLASRVDPMVALRYE